ncbi:MAG: hypothetical protein WC565_03090 [Parcubacteria group bacterium]
MTLTYAERITLKREIDQERRRRLPKTEARLRIVEPPRPLGTNDDDLFARAMGPEIRRQYAVNGISARRISDLLGVELALVLRILRGYIPTNVLRGHHEIYWHPKRRDYVVGTRL